MAAKSELGCTVASDPEQQEQLRNLWKDWLEDLAEPGLLDVARGNRYTSSCSVPCTRLPPTGGGGATSGYPGPTTARTPHVFEKQLKWPLDGGCASLGPELWLCEDHMGLR